ncbi:PhnD/SsuA/transferrin family substrate-binding protein [Aquicoccus sp. SCR17]|nr:PhnD/SsuA/transferrin family substrate-binding protein [Carideicomes alvinocaridis]
MRQFAKSAFIAAAAALTALPAAAQDLTTLRVSIIPIIDIAPLQIAMTKGFFEEEGIEIDTTPTAGGAVGLPALASGAVDVTFSNSVSIALGAAQGLGFKVIAAGSFTGKEAPDIAAIVAKPDAGIKTGADLDGKKLAVNTRNNVIWLYANAWVDATGGDSSSVTYLEVPFPQMLDAIDGGQVDAAFLVDPFLNAGVSGGAVEVAGYPYNTIQSEIPIGMYAVTEDFLADNPDVVDSFVTAYNKGVDWANDNAGSDEWNEIVSGYTRLPAERLAGLDIPPFHKVVDPEALQPTMDLMLKYGLLREEMEASSILADSVLAK